MNKLKNKKLFLLDMDGTLYIGDRVFNKTVDFLEYIKESGKKYLFLTNNSSKSVEKYIEKLGKMGISANCDDFLNSTQATAIYLKKNYKDKKIYAFGTTSFKEQLKKEKLKIVEDLEEDISCLVVGFDEEMSFKKIEDACILLNKKVDYIATNPDLVCPTEYGFIPDCGSICEMIYNATKRKPLFIGKPNKIMVELAMKKTGCKKEDTIIIGDRTYTDIACGINCKISTALVLSGETTAKEVSTSRYKSEYVFEDIKEIYDVLRS